MVNVTKSNFLTSLHDLLSHLPNASYIAIDEEMTGIRNITKVGNSNSRPNKAELPSERYTSSWKSVPEQYGILQVGVALFIRNPNYRDDNDDDVVTATNNVGEDVKSRDNVGGPGLGNGQVETSNVVQDDNTNNQDEIDVNEHPFIHREGTLNQDELEDVTEREEDAANAAAATTTSKKDDVPEYTSRIYNFYLFPNGTRNITLSTDTVSFLLENKMDFNKVFSEGISYTTVEKASIWKKKFLNKKKQQLKLNGGDGENSSGVNGGGGGAKTNSTPRKNKVKLTRTEDIAFVARTMASLREWIDTDENNGNNEEEEIVQDGNNNAGGGVGGHTNGVNGENHNDAEADNNTGLGKREIEGSSLVLPPCNAFLRRCLYETIEEEYPGLVLERAASGPTAGPAANQIRVIRLSSTEKKRREERLLQEEWSKLLYSIGFTTVFQAISDACNGRTFSDKQTNAFFAGESSDVSSPGDGNKKIPLIVHNGLMDLMFLLTHCHGESLPESFEDTKRIIRGYFPYVYDTKILSTECSDAVVRGGNTALGELYQSVFSPEMNDLELKKATIMNGDSSEQAHEAAWDAYMTGCVYYALCKKILEPNNDSRLALSRILEHESVGSLHRNTLGLNKIYMHMSLYTIDLESSPGIVGFCDPLSHGLSVNTTFYVSGIDTNVSTRDILRALTDGNQRNETEVLQHLKYEIIWIDDESFFVGTKLDNLVSVGDSGSVNFIALHVHHQLHVGLKGVKVVNLVDYFAQKNTEKETIIGSIATAVKRLFGGGKRSLDGASGNGQANKRRRVS